MIGQTISHYKILEKLGRCETKVTEETVQGQVTKNVAMKLLPHIYAHFD